MYNQAKYFRRPKNVAILPSCGSKPRLFKGNPGFSTKKIQIRLRSFRHTNPPVYHTFPKRTTGVDACRGVCMPK